MVLTTRAALEAKVANFGNADDMTREAMKLLRELKETVPADEATALDDVLASYETALDSIAARGDDSSKKIMNAATLLEGHRATMAPEPTP